MGGQAAHALCFRGNDVTVVDVDEGALARLRGSSDVMTLVGNAAQPETLIEAGVERADIVLALTGNSEVNLVVCTLAKSFGVAKKVARLSTRRYFAPERNLSPELYGIDDFIIPEEDCVRDIMDALTRPAVKESAAIGPKSCEVVNFQVPTASPLDGVELQNAPCPELLERLRSCHHYFYAIPQEPRTVDRVKLGLVKDSLAALVENGALWRPRDRADMMSARHGMRDLPKEEVAEIVVCLCRAKACSREAMDILLDGHIGFKVLGDWAMIERLLNMLPHVRCPGHRFGGRRRGAAVSDP